MRWILLAAMLALALAPAASAHTTYFTSDGKYRISTGQLNEPVITYSKTGLDLCFTLNNTARDPVNVNAGALTATLVAPDGRELTQALRTQFGRAGCYQFQDAYVLTLPGQYTIDLSGDINGTALDFKAMTAGGIVGNASTLTFPQTPIASQEDLQRHNDQLAQRVAALESAKTALEQRLQKLETADTSETSKGAPMAPLALGILALAAVAVLRRRA